MKLLDLFCGQGGAAVGYHRAGFEIVGVDIEPQPCYPFAFHQADAMTFPLDGFDVVHASPPCQRFIRSGMVNKSGRPDLLTPTRERLKRWGGPWVIENVPGAPMRVDLMLCGSMFGLTLRRHRQFESNQTMPLAPKCDHSGPVVGVYGHPHGQRGAWPGMLPSTLETWKTAMGIYWMDVRGLSQAIPPAYTKFIGRHLRSEIRA